MRFLWSGEKNFKGSIEYIRLLKPRFPNLRNGINLSKFWKCLIVVSTLLKRIYLEPVNPWFISKYIFLRSPSLHTTSSLHPPPLSLMLSFKHSYQRICTLLSQNDGFIGLYEQQAGYHEDTQFLQIL